MSEIRISPLPQVAGQRSPVLDKAAAQRSNYGFGIASAAQAPDSEMTGLVNGLATLNPALASYNEQNIRTEAEAANKAGVAEANRMAMSGIAERELVGQPLPSSVPPAFDNAFRTGLKSVLGDRSAASVRDEIATAYNEQKDKEGFDPAKFLAESRATALAGFADPDMAAKVGAGVNQMEVLIRSDVEKDRLSKQTEAVNTSLAQVVREKMPPTASADALFAAYTTEVLPMFRAVNKSPKDAQAYLFNHLSDLSSKLGGAPQLFEVFNMPNAEGKTLTDYNPEMGGKVRAAQEAARTTMERKLLEEGTKARFATFVDLDRQRDANPGSITPELVASNIGKFNLFQTEEAAHSYWAQANRMAQQGMATAALSANWDESNMGRLPPDMQRDVAEGKLKPQIDLMFKAAAGGKPADVATLASSIIKELSSRKMTVTLPAMERFVETVGITMQSKDGPDAAFQSRVELYKAFSAAPLMRNNYFKGDSADIMDTYTKLVASGTDPKAAYASAFQSVTPEAKKAAEEHAKTPEFIKTAKAAVDKVVGSSMIPQWLGGSGRPGNTETVAVDTKMAMTAYLRQHPNATDSDAQAFAKNYVQGNWIHDETTGAAIKVPTAFANPGMQEAMSEFSKKLLDQNLVGSRQDGDWKVEYRMQGTEGAVDVVLVNGAAMTPIASTTLANIQREHVNAKLIDHSPVAPGGAPNEAMRLQEIQRQVSSGTVDPMYLAANKELIAKATALGVLPKGTTRKLETLASDQFIKRMREIPAMSFGRSDPSTLNTSPKPGSALKIDNKVTAKIALGYLTTATGGPLLPDTLARQLALSLITVGEGVATHTYADPAAGAGNNIGTGYNLNAHKDTAYSDLKRSGVPESQIAGVISGALQMTPEQVSRLTAVSVEQYEKLAKNAAEQTSPGLWQKMTVHQRAVMIDVAYQVKDITVFKKAWAALASGDQATFAEHSKVTYKKPSGERVYDTRRNSLRADMLAGTPQWTATVNKYGSFPSNALDVAALNK